MANPLFAEGDSLTVSVSPGKRYVVSLISAAETWGRTVTMTQQTKFGTGKAESFTADTITEIVAAFDKLFFEISGVASNEVRVGVTLIRN